MSGPGPLHRVSGKHHDGPYAELIYFTHGLSSQAPPGIPAKDEVTAGNYYIITLCNSRENHIPQTIEIMTGVIYYKGYGTGVSQEDIRDEERKGDKAAPAPGGEGELL
jgi:hypothetical protein